MLNLRDYQTDVIKRTYESMRSGHHRPMVVLPTGSGKTVIFAWLASQTQRKGKTVWFVVHRNELMDQTIDTFKRFDIPDGNIHIGMVHSFAHHPERYPKPDLIILDEAHHVSASTWMRIIQDNPGVYVIGLTATPCRLDGRPLGEVFDDMVVGATTRELTDAGYLAPYRYFAPSVADLSGLNRKGVDYDQEQASDILMQRAVFGDVIKHWHEYADGLQTICYCSSIKHSHATSEAFRADGINAVHFDGNTPKQERADIIRRFRTGEIRILCNVDLIGEGFDVPDCWCCVLLRPTTSLGLFIQQSGRALRPQTGKTAIILDHVGNYTRHGLPDDLRNWSLHTPVKPSARFDTEGKLLVRQCLNCYGTYRSALKCCPYCGFEYVSTREEIERIESVRLEEVMQRKEASMERYREKTAERVKDGGIESCHSLFETQQWCKANGRSSGFAWVWWNKLRKY